MNQHPNDLNYRMVRVRAGRDGFGARDPTLPLIADALDRRRLNANAGPISKTRLPRKRIAKFNWDTIAIWAFLLVVTVVSLLVAHQLWIQFHLR